MERVALYKFNEDDSGKVIAESKVEDIDSYLNLYYPASDIPPQARDLYTVNWVRLVPNVDLEPTKLIPGVSEADRQPLDLTHSLLRTMSPIHRQYVRNQGLKASFSLSLVTHNKLWGLITCHSREATYIPQDVRLQCENLSQLFSWHLYAKEEELFINQKQEADRSIEAMLDKVSPKNPIVKVFAEYEDDVLRLMDADGFLFFSDHEVISLGVTPEISVVEKIHQSSLDGQGKPFITDSVGDQFGPQEQLNGIVGILLIPFLERRSYYTAWFRKEHRYTQKWAGPEHEKNANASKRERLTPRSSFKVHVKDITGESKPFDKNDLDMAGRLNRMFLAHALEVQEKLRKGMNDLEKQDQHKNEFLATLAHELRNPLSPISSGVTLLESSDDRAIRSRVVGIIKRQVNYMKKLIDDLMDVSRITQGKIELDMRSISLQEVIANAIEIVDEPLQEKSHTLDLNLPKEKVLVNGDSARLSQIFSNILNNAIKYTEYGGKLSVTLKQDGERAAVIVKDNGLGIPKERIKDIFSMFTQVEAHSTYTKGGLGIGLTLVERLVKLHQGEIQARSDGPGQGSEFEVLLPAQDQVSSEAELTEETLETKQALTILVVDDNTDVTSLLEILLSGEGHKPITAHNGREAIEKFKFFEPQIAILDIGMPDMDGYELCEALRDLPEAKDTIFFAQSGWGNQEYVDRALQVGFHRHFVKPLDFKTLKAAINEYVD